ncbi:MAG: efflux RND transporter periplasmic adaptor subunit [Candidatus Aminicenantes bacterium]|nr:efflux RND transporter periplasmic adaptor subunit [Candidatus Aminicenantes bacterium]
MFKINQSKGAYLLLLATVALMIGCGVENELELAGILERRTLEISAPISEIIVDLPVQVGEQVKKDTVIVQLDTEVVAAELKAHEAAHSAANALLKEAKGEFSRQDRLRRAKIATTQAYDKAKRKRDEAISLVAEKEARIAQGRKRLNDLTIRSRASGFLDQLPYEVGERAPAGGVVAVVISDEAPWIRVWLPTRAVARIRLGQEAKVKVAGIKTWFKGKVEHVSRKPGFTPHYALTERETAHLVYETRIRLIDPKRDLPPGIPARVILPLDKAGEVADKSQKDVENDRNNPDKKDG